jgi:lantibiotic modifying enzyme
MNTTTIPFSRQQRITNSLLLNASFIENIGLMHGKMGIAIYFFRLARETGNVVYDEYAGELIDEIYEEIHAKTPCDFENGLSGIGWGIEYLIKNKFIDADSNEVLEDIDNQIIHEITFHAPKDIGLLYGLCGYMTYFMNRLQSNSPGSKRYETLHKALVDTVDQLQQRVDNQNIHIVTDELWKEPEIFNLTWNYPLVLVVLAELLKMGLCIEQSKVLIKKLVLPLEEGGFIPKLQSQRLFLALVLEKIKQGIPGKIHIHIPESLNGILKENNRRETIANELAPKSAFLKNGTMGISHIYNEFFQITKDTYFKNESEYWKKAGFDFPESDQGYAGFNIEKKHQNKACGILEGIAGILIVDFFRFN